MWATIIFVSTGTMFLAMTLASLVHLRWVRRLPSLKSLEAGAGPASPISCSVVVAARDEEARVEDTIRHLLAQRGLEAEFIVVDDRSTDGTGEILKRLAKLDERLRIKRVEVLPEGWLGKCYACHVGASTIERDWILFTDADCWLKPDVIARAVRLAERDGADHVTLSAGIVAESRWVRAWHLLFLTSLLNWFSAVNRDRSGSYLGLGAFNLVRTAAYRQCGGYQALRLTVLDDVKLGLLLSRAGKRTRAFLGADDVQCHWGNTVGSMIQIMEKNYFAAIDFRLGLALAGGAFTILVFSIVLLGLSMRTMAGLLAGLAPLSLILPAAILARRVGWSWPSAIYVPFMFPVLIYAMANSTWVTVRQGGVRWRDHFYPLAILKAGNVR